MDHGRQWLERLLDYELRAAARYRRFVSLVLMFSVNTDKVSTSEIRNVNMKNLLANELRCSDEFIALNGTNAIAMSETETGGALIAIRRYQTACGDLDLRFAVASFPDDGPTSENLLATATWRLDVAKKGDHSSVVDTGSVEETAPGNPGNLMQVTL